MRRSLNGTGISTTHGDLIRNIICALKQLTVIFCLKVIFVVCHLIPLGFARLKVSVRLQMYLKEPGSFQKVFEQILNCYDSSKSANSEPRLHQFPPIMLIIEPRMVNQFLST